MLFTNASKTDDALPKLTRKISKALSCCLNPHLCGCVCFAGLLLLGTLASCTPNYFVDPISTPVFTAPGQIEVQGSIALHDKLYFENAYSLPFNMAVEATYSGWGGGFDNDQQMTSFATGHFWPSKESTVLALAGYGSGSHRLSNYSAFTGSDDVQKILNGYYDFHKLYLEISYAVTLPNLPLESFIGNGIIESGYGLAARLDNLDRYQFFESTKEWTNGTSDTTVTIANGDRRSWQIDLAAFFETGVQPIQLYSQALLQIPLKKYSDDYLDLFSASVGIRFNF